MFRTVSLIYLSLICEYQIHKGITRRYYVVLSFRCLYCCWSSEFQFLWVSHWTTVKSELLLYLHIFICLCIWRVGFMFVCLYWNWCFYQLMKKRYQQTHKSLIVWWHLFEFPEQMLLNIQMLVSLFVYLICYGTPVTLIDPGFRWAVETCSEKHYYDFTSSG